MNNFYLILVVILFALAISDLIVGVSNDAVNFLNSAIGSKAAPKWIIFLVAAIGVLVGATFSSGMMEVARKGIFHPNMFFFSEIMIIFLAVMITDIILLDLFNTLSLPTSTTVSIVFELLGSAVVVSIIKIKQSGGTILNLSQYINSEKALEIIVGILLSVLIAFTVGTIIQYITRFIFSFRYAKPLKYFGSFFGGLAITAITYFILVKGMNGSSFADIVLKNGQTLQEWVFSNSTSIIIFSFLGWTLFMEILKSFLKVDILKIIVLVGTFALAMAFAGNDLVNFIGVPIAGFKSFQEWSSIGNIVPEEFRMDMLSGKVSTPVYMLLLSGLIMIITLISSKKARSVTETEVNLGRQNEGAERFGSSLIARFMVRRSLKFNNNISKLVPKKLSSFTSKRFETVSLGNPDDSNTPAFDKIRASCNLVIASILISIGTSLKLPLSTTYVTFMVAMGTSLADRAWDRESAVYRISGVFTVIGGWFLTALIAFTVSGIIALFITLGGKFMIFVFIAVAIFMVIRTYKIFHKKQALEKSDDDEIITEKDASDKIMEKCKKQVVSTILSSNKIFSVCIDSFLKEDRSNIRTSLDLKNHLNKKTKKQKNKAFSTISKLQQEDIDSGHIYVQVLNYQKELSNSLNFLTVPLFEHLDNNHKPFKKAQEIELNNLILQVDEFFNFALHIIKEEKFDQFDELLNLSNNLIEVLSTFEKEQIKRIKYGNVNTRNSIVFFNILTETKNLLLHSVNLVKTYIKFIEHTIKNQEESS